MSKNKVVLSSFLPLQFPVGGQTLAGSPQPLLLPDGNNVLFPVYLDPEIKTKTIHVRLAGTCSASPIEIDLYNMHGIAANVFTGDSVSPVGNGTFLLDFTMTWGYEDPVNPTYVWFMGSGFALQPDGSTRIIAFYYRHMASALYNAQIQPQASGSGTIQIEYLSVEDVES